VKVNYLGADVPLSKTFEEVAPGNYKELSYPHVARFTSIEKDVVDLDSFYATTIAAANEGLCLLKGQLDRPLVNESRAGHTDSTAGTEWLCLDVDMTVVDLTPTQFLDSLGKEFKDVSFFFQYSAGMGIKTSQGWRGHYFILVDSLTSPQALKQWLISRNLSIPMLNENIRLSASGGALIFPLDITTCQNDKLLYITPPVCVGFDDPVSSRFRLVQRGKEHVTGKFNVSAAQNRTKINTKIKELRDVTGLKPKEFKLVQHQGWEVITNPDPVTVTGKKEARDFVYLNLNGGDSWGYYFPITNPDILYNFKGEPCMYMWDVDKDIYNEYAIKPQSSEGAIPFGLLWPDDDNYYRGFANPETKELLWLKPIGSKAKLRDFYSQHGIQVPSGWAVDEWQLTFDPGSEGYADFTEKRINTYRRTEYILNAKTTESNIPPTIDRVINSVCVAEEVKRYFINWLAHIFQTREKTNTAWIFQGVQGTGKGVLFSHIIAPLIGRQYCHEMTMDRLDDDFNAYLSENIVLFIDEAKISDSRNGDRLLNRIKNLITEPEQHIRAMRRNAVTRTNYSNIILASNYDEIIPLERTDRRFNVAPRQETPIQLEYEDIVHIRAELADFANYLHTYAVDHQKVRKVLLSDARNQLIKLSETTVDAFFLAAKHGQLDYFAQYLDSSTKSDLEGMRYHDFALAVKRWLKHANEVTSVPRSELHMCYQYLQNTSISTTKFSRMAAKYGLTMEPIRVDGQVTRGLRDVVWKLNEEELELHKDVESDKVIQLRRKE
jgi:hypothetical protein